MAATTAACADCGAPLTPMDTRCPQCGSGDRDVITADRAAAYESELSMEQSADPNAQPDPDAWREQWRRVQRWYDDFTRTYQGRPATNGGTDWLSDCALAFFVFAYHLADWLDKSQPPAPDQQRAHAYVLDTDALRWCRDLGNATKHLVLDSKRYPPNAPDTAMSRKDVHLTINEPGGHTEAKIRLYVSATVSGVREERDALELATKCMTAWEAFLAGRGLAVD